MNSIDERGHALLTSGGQAFRAAVNPQQRFSGKANHWEQVNREATRYEIRPFPFTLPGAGCGGNSGKDRTEIYLGVLFRSVPGSRQFLDFAGEIGDSSLFRKYYNRQQCGQSFNKLALLKPDRQDAQIGQDCTSEAKAVLDLGLADPAFYSD